MRCKKWEKAEDRREERRKDYYYSINVYTFGKVYYNMLFIYLQSFQDLYKHIDFREADFFLFLSLSLSLIMKNIRKIVIQNMQLLTSFEFLIDSTSLFDACAHQNRKSLIRKRCVIDQLPCSL